MAPAWQVRRTAGWSSTAWLGDDHRPQPYAARVGVEHSTTADVPEPPYSSRARWSTRIGRSAVVLFVLAGAVGLLGPKSGEASAEGAGFQLRVAYPSITRAGQPAPLHLQVEKAGGFDGPVQLSLCDSFFDDLDFQSWYPTPSAETGSGAELVYEFDPPPGDVLEVSLDARSAPGQFGEVEDCRIAVLQQDIPVAEVSFGSWRMP